MPRKLSLLLIGSVLVFLTLPSIAMASVRVVTTIQPLALIVRAVAGETAHISTLIEKQDSAHHFTLSPGDRLAIEGADVLLWIGPDFEVFLNTMMSRLVDQTLLTALALPEMTLHRLDDETIDPHVWLDPANAQVIAAAIAGELTRLDPDNRQRYSDNLTAFTQALARIEGEIAGELAELPEFSFAVYHNAYQYFEQRFGLAHGVALVHNPEVAPGIQQTLRTQARVREVAPACVLIEPDYSPALLATLMGDSRAQQIEVDLLGYDLDMTGTTALTATANYEQLLNTIAASFQRCASAP